MNRSAAVATARDLLDQVEARFPFELTLGVWPDMQIVGDHLKAMD